jgi:hypothetical protein
MKVPALLLQREKEAINRVENKENNFLSICKELRFIKVDKST